MFAALDERNIFESGNGPQSALFGPFEIRLDTRELLKNGAKVRLQTKPFQILRALLERPGAVVTREDLRARLWSTDTYVDFESGLNTAVNRLRTALGDSAEHPVYIETLSRLGYRFIAPVKFAGSSLQVRNEETAVSMAEPAQVAGPALVADLQQVIAPRARYRWVLIALVLLAFGANLLWVIGSVNRQSTPIMRQLTFRNGTISRARFSRDGRKIIYSAAWNGSLSQPFVLDPLTQDIRPIGIAGAELFGISPANQLAVYLQPVEFQRPTLALFGLSGGRAQPLPEDVTGIDWGPNGTECLILAQPSGHSIEYPPGRTIYETNDSIDFLRVSPDGKRLAFLRHPVPEDDGGDLVVLEPGLPPRVLSRNWASIRGLAWTPSGHEVWFTAAASGIDRQLRAVDLRGKIRQISQVPGGISLQDISPAGDVLITRDASQMSMLWGQFNTRTIRDVSWLDWPFVEAITANGKQVLFDESGEGGGKEYSTYLYNADTPSYRRLGAGRAIDISSDGQWTLTQAAHNADTLTLVSVATGQSRSIAVRNFFYRWARFLPGSDSEIVVGGGYESEREGVFRQHLPDGNLVPVSTSAKLNSAVVDEGGHFIAGLSSEGTISRIDLVHGTTRSTARPDRLIPVGFRDDDNIICWHPEPAGSIELDVMNLDTGAIRLYRRIDGGPTVTSDAATIAVSRDGSAYVFSRLHVLSTLFDVRGWR